MEISLQVNIDKNVSVKYEPASFDIRFIEQSNSHITLKLNRNHLSELITIGMGCVIQLQPVKNEIPGSVSKIEISNGEMTIICKVMVKNKEIIGNFA